MDGKRGSTRLVLPVLQEVAEDQIQRVAMSPRRKSRSMSSSPRETKISKAKHLVANGEMEKWLDVMNQKDLWKKVMEKDEYTGYTATTVPIMHDNGPEQKKMFMVQVEMDASKHEVVLNKRDSIQKMYRFMRSRNVSQARKYAKGLLVWKKLEAEEIVEEEDHVIDYSELWYQEYKLAWPFRHRYYLAAERMLCMDDELLIFTKTLPRESDIVDDSQLQVVQLQPRRRLRGEMVSLRHLWMFEQDGKVHLGGSLLVWGDPKVVQGITSSKKMVAMYAEDLKNSILLSLEQ